MFDRPCGRQAFVHIELISRNTLEAHEYSQGSILVESVNGTLQRFDCNLLVRRLVITNHSIYKQHFPRNAGAKINWSCHWLHLTTQKDLTEFQTITFYSCLVYSVLETAGDIVHH
jgi:hypothetical protein